MINIKYLLNVWLIVAAFLWSSQPFGFLVCFEAVSLYIAQAGLELFRLKPSSPLSLQSKLTTGTRHHPDSLASGSKLSTIKPYFEILDYRSLSQTVTMPGVWTGTWKRLIAISVLLWGPSLAFPAHESSPWIPLREGITEFLLPLVSTYASFCHWLDHSFSFLWI